MLPSVFILAPYTPRYFYAVVLATGHTVSQENEG